jgi:hypothetical protein
MLQVRDRPGELLKATLEKMGGYLGERADGAGEDMGPRVMTYLSSVLMPAANGSMTMRNERELRTIAMAIDAILRGKVAEAADFLIQRFKAVETAHHDGHWNTARHLEALPPPKVSAVDQEERESILRAEERESRFRKLAESYRGGGARRGGE